MEQEILNAAITRNFLYFTANSPPGFIKKVWQDDSVLAKHLQSKFDSVSKNGFVNAGSFMRWFFELTGENQTKLINWVTQNYKGI